ncbi:MAG: diversity-generating retroelement protein Avd [Pirellulaceae bacterium]
MPPASTPLFVKTHDFTVWLLRHTQRFPKHLRHSYTLRLENACFDFEERILLANSARAEVRAEYLQQADGRLLVLRSLLRYSVDLELLGSRQLEHAAQCIDELGRLLGAWMRKGMNR